MHPVGAALLSPFTPVAEAALNEVSFSLTVNDELKQSGHVNQMIFDIGFQLRYLNSFVPLLPGDLIYTGTPEGVGPLQKGDRVSLRYLSGVPDTPTFEGVL